MPGYCVIHYDINSSQHLKRKSTMKLKQSLDWKEVKCLLSNLCIYAYAENTNKQKHIQFNWFYLWFFYLFVFLTGKGNILPLFTFWELCNLPPANQNCDSANNVAWLVSYKTEAYITAGTLR